MLFLLKIAVTPLLVAAVSLAARRWGPTFGGLIMGLPWMTGPVLFFLGLDKGEAFAVHACVGIELGVLCVCALALGYATTSLRASWPVCLAAGIVSFAAVGWLVQGHPISLPVAAGMAAIGLVATYLLLPWPRSSAALAALPWWDIPARMLAAAALVALIMLTADRLGPQLSGIVSTFPVLLIVVGVFTHRQWGVDALWRVQRGLVVSLANFVAFFLVVGLTLPTLGLVGAFALAAATALAGSTILIAVNRRRAGR